MDLTPTSIFKNKEKQQSKNQSMREFKTAFEKTNSQRQAEKLTGIPRSTASYRENRQQSCDLDDRIIEFFATPVGMNFLHRLTVAVEFIFSQMSGAGISMIQLFYELSQLDRLVACSFGSLQKRIEILENNLIEFGKLQEIKLVKKMPSGRLITACMDETFPSGIYLVAMEPVSNFILLEQMAQKRDCETWDNAMKQRLDALPVTVVQVTSDEASALIKYTEKCLDAHHSPDLFHVQQDVSKATAFPLESRITTAESEVEKASLEVSHWEKKQQAYEALPEKPLGRPIDYAARIADGVQAKEQAVQHLKEAEDRRESVREANRSLSEVYHPFELETGAKRTPKQLRQALNKVFDNIEICANEAELSESSVKRIGKARRLIDSMVNTLVFFWSVIAIQIKAMELSKELEAVFKKTLLPAVYIEIVALKASSSELKNQRLERAKMFYDQLDQNEHWRLLSAEKKEKLTEQARQCANIFQRSSSNVEGRNGQLSLKHHIYKGMGQRKLAALTVLHNYFIRRPDGTTAAERFFGHPPDDLFAWLLKNTDYPALPAKKRSIVRILRAVA